MAAVQGQHQLEWIRFSVSLVCLVSLYGQQESIMKQELYSLVAIREADLLLAPPVVFTTALQPQCRSLERTTLSLSCSTCGYILIDNRAEVPARSYHWALSAWLLLG